MTLASWGNNMVFWFGRLEAGGYASLVARENGIVSPEYMYMEK